MPFEADRPHAQGICSSRAASRRRWGALRVARPLRRVQWALAWAALCALVLEGAPGLARDRVQGESRAATADRAAFSAEARRFSAIADEAPAVFSAVARRFFTIAGIDPGSLEPAPALGSLPTSASSPSRERSGPALPPALLAAAPPPIAVADRSRLIEELGLVRESLLNPYEQSTIKGDRPVFGDDRYLRLEIDSTTTIESGRLGAGLGAGRSGSEALLRQQVSTALSLSRGDTHFLPADWKVRVRTVAHAAGAESLAAKSATGRAPDSRRRDLGVEELFLETYLRTVSDRYDFQSLRLGIQPFVSDFRGLLLSDSQPGVRWYGNAADNTVQYNLIWMRRLQKDPVSGLNSSRWRDEDIVAANLYLQDVPWLGLQVQGTALYHRDDGGPESGEARGADHDVMYLGLNAEGHVDRLNLAAVAYTALGRDRRRMEGEAPREPSRQVRAHLLALEASVDFDWYRLKAFSLYASGDDDPGDGRSGGFDSVTDRPVLGGLEDGLLQRESLPIPVAGLLLTTRGGLLTSLRSARDRDSASFDNPGSRLFGVGADLDVLPELRVRLHASWRDFDQTGTLEALVGRSVDRHLGEDYSVALIYRPWLTNNVVVRASAAVFRTGDGLVDLLGARGSGTLYSTRLELSLSY